MKFPDLFAFDLDGTLVHSLPSGVRGIPEDLLSIVHKIATKASVVVATGRRYRASLADIASLPKMPYSILHNGLVIKDQDGKTLHRLELSTAKAVSIAQILQAENVDFFIAADGYEQEIDFLFLKDSLEKSEVMQNVYDRTKGANRVLKSLEDLHLFREAPLLEITSVAPYDDLLKAQEQLKTLLPKPYRALVIKNIGFSNYGALEIFPDTCSKWTGVDYVRNRVGASRVIAVGDDENDIEMIKSAHIGVVMGHAESHVKAVGSRHVDGPAELADFLKDFYSL